MPWTTKLVYVKLCDAAKATGTADGHADLSIGQIVADTGLCDRKVRYAVSDLTTMGLVRQVRKATRWSLGHYLVISTGTTCRSRIESTSAPGDFTSARGDVTSARGADTPHPTIPPPPKPPAAETAAGKAGEGAPLGAVQSFRAWTADYLADDAVYRRKEGYKLVTASRTEDNCAACGRSIAVGTRKWWNPDTAEVLHVLGDCWDFTQDDFKVPYYEDMHGRLGLPDESAGEQMPDEKLQALIDQALANQTEAT
jgi:hypothetical protein